MNDTVRMLAAHFSYPKLWIPLVSLISLFLAWFSYALLGDFYPKRRRETRRLLKLDSQFREDQSESRVLLVKDLIRYMKSRNQFTSCYAANIASRLAKDFPDEGKSLIDALGMLLASEDMLKRHAAAQGLYHLGPGARTEREQIQKASEDYREESAGAIASRLIRQLDNPPTWWADSTH